MRKGLAAEVAKFFLKMVGIFTKSKEMVRLDKRALTEVQASPGASEMAPMIIL